MLVTVTTAGAAGLTLTVFTPATAGGFTVSLANPITYRVVTVKGRRALRSGKCTWFTAKAAAAYNGVATPGAVKALSGLLAGNAAAVAAASSGLPRLPAKALSSYNAVVAVNAYSTAAAAGAYATLAAAVIA